MKKRSKHREEVIMILSADQIKSTREIQRELQDRTKKIINWGALFRILSNLEEDGRVKRYETSGGIYWLKKE